MKLSALAGAVVLALLAGGASAQAFPEKPVRFIVPFPPGGGTDALARILAAKLGEAWGQQVIIDNRAGAQGGIGTAAGAKAAPDGYTLTFAHQGALVINPHLYAATGYDTRKAFVRVAKTTEMAFIAVAHPSVPAANLKELEAHARQNPGKLTFASTSAGPHVVGELFRLTTKTSLVHVPYKGAGPAITALVAGEVQVMMATPPLSLPQIRAGRIRPLAYNHSARAPFLPDVPTMSEAGVQNTQMEASWHGLLAPAKTPIQIRRIIAKATQDALNDSETTRRLTQVGYVLGASTPERFGEAIAVESKQQAERLLASGASLD